MSNEVVTRLRATGEEALAQGARHLGDVVTYDVERIRIPRAELRAAFDAEGFGQHVVETLTPAAALGRAAARPVPRQILCEAFARPNKDAPIAIGVYLKSEGQIAEGGDKIVCGARVRAVGDTVVAMSPEGGFSEPTCYEIAERIARDARELLTTAETTDVTAAVISVLTHSLSAVPMRKRGGVYFLRPREGERWLKLAARLLPFGFVDLSYPMTRDARSNAAAHHVVKASFEADLAALQKELSAMNDTTRDSTVERRVADCDAMVAKADLYAEILGDWLDKLRGQTDALKQQFRARLDDDADVFDFPKASDAPATLVAAAG